ncbi:MAG: gamma-glutamyltransferase [Armatimonadetes bacterium]|nr:gamma-glutamyltransferase [Armatimonadota bacterium]
MAHRGVVVSRNGMVCSAHPLASMAGIRMLQAGGNFIDAALATAAVLNVVEPYNSHLGGDVFMLIYPRREGKVLALNGSGAAPLRASRDFFRAQGGIPVHGMAAASVPGQAHGWLTAWERFGSKPLPEILEPAIACAGEGFPVNYRLSAVLEGSSGFLRERPAAARVYMPKGRPPLPGEVLTQPDLARSLRLIAEGGIPAYYRGPIARGLVAHAEAHGGLFSMEDFARHASRWYDPLQTDYRGYTVYEQPPASQGHILLQELDLVEGFDLAALGAGSAEAIHLLIEAKKLAFADRQAYTTDPDFADIPMRGLLSKEYAARRRVLISPDQAALPAAGDPNPYGSDTTYFCVADGEGNAVSWIQSLFHGFGCGVFVDGLGMWLNNRMTGFSLDDGHVNRLEPGKKTAHTLNTYMIFRDGGLFVIGGTPGGDVQVQTNLQVITGLIDFGMSVQDAIEAPKWASGGGLDVAIEGRAGEETIAALRRKGHRVAVGDAWSGGCAAQVIQVHPETGALMGGSDPRADGCAAGW